MANVIEHPGRYATLWAEEGELVSLDWSDIDVEKKTALVRGLSGTASKNGQIRGVPLSTKAISAIESLRNLPEISQNSEIPADDSANLDISKPKFDFGDRIFPVLQETLRETFIKCVKRAGIKNFRFHHLRHESISRLAAIFPSPLHLQKVSLVIGASQTT
jgi:integrase